MAFREPSEKVKAMVAAASPQTQRLFEKAEGLNLVESPFLKEWLQSVLEGRPDLAERLVDHGMRDEHFKSVLNEFPETIPTDAADIRDALAEEFASHRKEFAGRNQQQPDDGEDFDDVKDRRD